MDRSNSFLIKIVFFFFWRKVGLKTACLTWKKVKHLIKVLVFCWYLIRFNSDFNSWTIVLKGKIWLTRWPKIQSDQTIESKSQLFDHTQLGLLVLIAIRGILNVATLWSTIQSCCIYLLPFFGYETCNLHLFFFFRILAFVLTRESGLDKIRYRQQWDR